MSVLRARTKWSSTLGGGQRGFSLIELIVTMAVIGILVVIGLPAMQSWLDRYRTRSAAQEIATTIQLQRMRAVSQSDEFSIAFNVGAGTFSLFEGDAATGTQLDAVPRGLPFGVTFSGGPSGGPIDVPGAELFFHPDGTLGDSTAATDAVYLSNSIGDTFEVEFNRATGRVEVSMWAYGY